MKGINDAFSKEKLEETGEGDPTVNISNVAGASSLFKIVPEVEIGMLVILVIIPIREHSNKCQDATDPAEAGNAKDVSQKRKGICFSLR